MEHVHISEQAVKEDARTQEWEDFNLRAVKGNLVWPAVACNICLAFQLCNGYASSVWKSY